MTDSFHRPPEPPDPFDSPEWDAYARRVVTELVPMIADSVATAIILSPNDPDVKIAVELGFSILLNKPIVAVRAPGVTVPPKLAAIADEIVDFIPGDDARTMEALNRALQRLGLAPRA
jgi:hypothetical protein